jgi:hypothetical protein
MDAEKIANKIQILFTIKIISNLGIIYLVRNSYKKNTMQTLCNGEIISFTTRKGQ